MDTAKLVAARERKGHSQAKLAEEVQVSNMTIIRWEHGESEPQEDNLQRLCEVLGLTPEELRGSAADAPIELLAVSEQLEPTQCLRTAIKQDLTMRLESLATLPYQTYYEVHGAMARILKDYENMNTKNHQINRRNALRRLVTLPFAIPGLAAALTSEESPSATVSKDLLAQCAVSIGACWELRKSTDHSDFMLAFDGVSAYIPTLQRIVKDHDQYRQEAAGLVAQCLFLKSMIGLHLEGLQEALHYAQQARVYSEIAQDASLQLKALERLALMYAYGKRNRQAQQIIEQAIPFLKRRDTQLSPQIQALVNGMLACAVSRNGQDGSAYLEQANSFFTPRKSTNRLPNSPIYIAYDECDLLLDTGITYFYQGKTTEAVDTFSKVVDPKTFALKMSWDETRRVQTINMMTMASLKAKNMNQAIHFWTNGIEGAKKLKSEQRFNEAITAYDIMQVLWPDESRVTELRDLTEHW